MDVDVAIVNGWGGKEPLPVFHVTKRHLAI